MIQPRPVSGLYSQRAALPYVGHNATMSALLSTHIMLEGERHGWWKPGDRVLDPMAGVGNGLIPWLRNGYAVTGIEIEDDYALVLKQRLQDASAVTFGNPTYHAVCGDAIEVLGFWLCLDGKYEFDACVTSPPYMSTLRPGDEGPYAEPITDPDTKLARTVERRNPKVGAYGVTPGQLAVMKDDEFALTLMLIYERMGKLLTGSRVAAFVTKDYQANNQRVSVRETLWSCLTGAGYEIIDWEHATGAPGGMWKKIANREHRRLGRYDLVIDHEDITYARYTGVKQ